MASPGLTNFQFRTPIICELFSLQFSKLTTILCNPPPTNKQATAATDENEKELRRDPREFHNWAGRGAAKIILHEAVSCSEMRILTCTNNSTLNTISSPVDKNGQIRHID